MWSNCERISMLLINQDDDRTLLAHVRTLYSTCHKFNESFVCVCV